jgi:hypothetical protein
MFAINYFGYTVYPTFSGGRPSKDFKKLVDEVNRQYNHSQIADLEDDPFVSKWGLRINGHHPSDILSYLENRPSFPPF